MVELKPTNPKDAVGATKLPLNLVPSTVLAYLSVAFYEGATKYGAYNWRAIGVRNSIYIAAALRHIAKYWNGEECDPKTKVPHLASAAACMAIILDAKTVGKLTDDRPPVAELDKLAQELEPVLRNLEELHKGLDPKHWTIGDDIPA
jgi:hypothetical protein